MKSRPEIPGGSFAFNKLSYFWLDYFKQVFYP